MNESILWDFSFFNLLYLNILSPPGIYFVVCAPKCMHARHVFTKQAMRGRSLWYSVAGTVCNCWTRSLHFSSVYYTVTRHVITFIYLRSQLMN